MRQAAALALAALISVLSKHIFLFSDINWYYYLQSGKDVVIAALLLHAARGNNLYFKAALVWLAWCVSDIVEHFFMRTYSFDINEYITASLTVVVVLIVKTHELPGREEDNGRVRSTDQRSTKIF